MHGLSSRPLPRDRPSGVVRGEAAVLVVSMSDCSSVKKECLLAVETPGDVFSGMPLLLAGLDCLHDKAINVMRGQPRRLRARQEHVSMVLLNVAGR